MKQLVKNFVLFSTVLLILTSLNSCRKGEHDPFISFKSRDARLLGKWKLTKAEGTTEYLNSFGEPYTHKYIYDGTTLTSYDYDTTSIKYSLEMEFKKKGEFIYIESAQEDTVISTESITSYWFWLDTDKKKTMLIFDMDSYFIDNGFKYIDKLSSKEMILKANYAYNSTNSSITSDKFSFTYTFSKE